MFANQLDGNRRGKQCIAGVTPRHGVQRFQGVVAQLQRRTGSGGSQFGLGIGAGLHHQTELGQAVQRLDRCRICATEQGVGLERIDVAEPVALATFGGDEHRDDIESTLVQGRQGIGPGAEMNLQFGSGPGQQPDQLDVEALGPTGIVEPLVRRVVGIAAHRQKLRCLGKRLGSHRRQQEKDPAPSGHCIRPLLA